LYYDDFANVRYANFSYEIYSTLGVFGSTWPTTAHNGDWGANLIVGNYSLIFIDHTGEDWETGPIDISANCDVLTNALEALPNNVIPKGSVRCFQDNNMNIPDVATGLGWFDYCQTYGICVGGLNVLSHQWDLTAQEYNLPYQGYNMPKFTIAFPSNPGKIQEIRINKFLDGRRPTLYTVEGTIYTAGSTMTTAQTFMSSLPKDISAHWNFFTQDPIARRLDFTTQELDVGAICNKLDALNPCAVSSMFEIDTSLPSTLGWHIYANGFTGEDTDFVPDLCEGITVTIDKTITAGKKYYKLGGMSVQDIKALKRCLADSDNITDNNMDVYNWDYGFGAAPGESFPSAGGEYGTSGTLNVPAYPHLIKLIDATQDYSYSNFDRTSSNPVLGKPNDRGAVQNDDDAVDRDHSVDMYPKTTLCASRDNYIDFPVNQHAGPVTVLNNAQMYDNGWCANKNPPGFFAALYFQPEGGATAGNYNQDGHGEFVLMGPTGQDFGLTNGAPTRFHLFTTTGMLVRISDVGSVYTAPNHASNMMGHIGQGSDFYSNTLFVGKDDGTPATIDSGTAPYDQWNGNFDCETNPTGTSGTRDCLSKDDYVMFFAGGQLSTATTPLFTRAVDNEALYKSSNAVYPNMYQVQKIGRMPIMSMRGGRIGASPNSRFAGYPGSAHADAAAFGPNYDRELTRNQIVLDYGVNVHWPSGSATNSLGGFAYKFYPPVDALFGDSGSEDSLAPPQRAPAKEVNYVGECSFRGICDESGQCKCFKGYTSDNCGVQSALVQ